MGSKYVKKVKIVVVVEGKVYGRNIYKLYIEVNLYIIYI